MAHRAPGRGNFVLRTPKAQPNKGATAMCGVLRITNPNELGRIWILLAGVSSLNETKLPARFLSAKGKNFPEKKKARPGVSLGVRHAEFGGARLRKANNHVAGG